jgi:glycine amidinotransferase
MKADLPSPVARAHVHEVPCQKAEPFGGALHCTTLDVYQEGTCEECFPKQFPGY